jgi:hypothetical protein
MTPAANLAMEASSRREPMPHPHPNSSRLELRVAVALTGVDDHQLWWDCVVLGAEGALSRTQIIDAVYDRPTPPSVFNMVATSVNERLLDLGLAPLVTLKPHC